MKRFYGDICSSSIEYLLKATPYSKEPRVNFDYELDKETFHTQLYADRVRHGTHANANDMFDRKVEKAFRELNNRFAKVSVLHVSGYAGCGKTTYVHHLLWTKRDIIGTYDVVDYEGCNRAVEPFIVRISHLVATYGNAMALCDYFDLVVKEGIFETIRFSQQIPSLERLSTLMRAALLTGKTKKSSIRALLTKFEREFTDETDYMCFLLFLELMLLLYDKISDDRSRPIVWVIDNSDSMSVLAEEAKLLSTFTRFANDCNYFFGDNLRNDASFGGRQVREVCGETKLLVIFTTRMATAGRYQTIHPDWEDIAGWTDARLPEFYYDHEQILLRRIEYYQNSEPYNRSETMDDLMRVRNLTHIAYHSKRFMRLFNGNVRTCIERLCGIAVEYPPAMIEELIGLYKNAPDYQGGTDGANGFLLCLLLDTFKQEKLYETKLDLSNWNEDGLISLSRIVLTILHEKGGRCSMLDMFKLLVPLGFGSARIASTVWNLCEEGRKVWRRLLVFDMVIPYRIGDLERQAQMFDEGDWDTGRYSEIVLCTAGRAYMEYVVPHFEFMLSRHDSNSSAVRDEGYQPLFCSESEKNVTNETEAVRYQFEAKIDTVFSDVRGCCRNSVLFAERAMKSFAMSQEEYISGSFFNYHKDSWDGEVGTKQSYESRLIFQHIGYIERYRMYLLNSHREDADEYLRDVNKRLVTRIIRYLVLYRDAFRCLGSRSLDYVANELMALAREIERSGFSDFSTRIELDY